MASAGAVPGLSLEERNLLARPGGTRSGPPADGPGGTVPAGTLGKVAVSRLILGGNLIRMFYNSTFAGSTKQVFISAVGLVCS